MDKQKIIKISIGGIVLICAIIYYLFTNDTSVQYENIIENSLVLENSTTFNNTISNNYETEKNKIKVYVTGEVKSPGVIELNEGDRIEDAINLVGGINENADLRDVNLAYEVSDGEKIYIPNKNDLEDENSLSEENFNTNNLNTSKNAKININKASVSELTSIPGVGESTASKIIAYREENGKFTSIDDLKKVSGIGNSKFENIKEYISVK